jgi:hypothetical protein
MKTAIPLVEIDLIAKHRAPGWREKCLAAAAETHGSLVVFEYEVWREIAKEPKLSTPTLKDLALRFSGAVATWVIAGFPVVSEDQLNKRWNKCQTCEHWERGTVFAHCRKCGCTKLKLWLATEICPAGKWDSLT